MRIESRHRVLVTGATGFTGGCLARTLARQGCQVRALVRDPRKGKDLVTHGIEVVEGDLIDRKSVVDAAKGVKQIYHIAAVYREARHLDSYYWNVNVCGTEHVLEAAARARVERVVHCSTAGVHGEICPIPATEDSPFRPDDAYQESKLEGERRVHDAIAAGLPAVVFRPAGIYGPGDLRFLKLFRSISKGHFVVIGSGNVLYHLTYIDDLVDGIIRCGQSLKALGNVYLLAGPRYATLLEIVSLIADALNVKAPRGRVPLWPVMAAGAGCEAVCRRMNIEPPLHRRRVDFFRKDRAFDTSRARADLGFEPKIDMHEGLARTARWYASKGLLDGIGCEASEIAAPGLNAAT